MKVVNVLAIVLSFTVVGCATLSDKGEKVKVVTTVDKECLNLGPVNVSVTGWGLPVESQNVLRNNTADLAGNTVVQTGAHTGIAYFCSPKSTAN